MRLFVAIDITNENTLMAISSIQKKLQIDAKPVEAKNLHFTMMFLGEVPETQRTVIQDSLKNISFESFEIKLRGIGIFPNLKRPRIVWIGTDEEGGNRLFNIAKLVEEALSPLGFVNDKPFKPHITIFRIKKRTESLSHLTEYQSHLFGTQFISEIKLKQSMLTPRGPSYTDLFVVRAKDEKKLAGTPDQ